MKKLFALVAFAALSIGLGACDFDPEDLEESLDQDTLENATYLTLGVNPEVEFVIDDEEAIISFLPLNEDAEIVLAELDLEGKPIEDGVEAFLDEAVETGYVDVDADDNIVFVNADEDDEAAEDDEDTFGRRMRERVESHLRGKGIAVAAIGGAVDEDERDLAEEHEIGIGELRLRQRAVEIDDDIEDLEASLEYDMPDIMQILHEQHREAMEEFREERGEAAGEMRQKMREEMAERLEDHRGRMDDEDIDLPDSEEIEEQLPEDLKERVEDFRERMRERRERMRDEMPGRGSD